jgi:hypothetical protein
MRTVAIMCNKAALIAAVVVITLTCVTLASEAEGLNNPYTLDIPLTQEEAKRAANNRRMLELKVAGQSGRAWRVKQAVDPLTTQTGSGQGRWCGSSAKQQMIVY